MQIYILYSSRLVAQRRSLINILLVRYKSSKPDRQKSTLYEFTGRQMERDPAVGTNRVSNESNVNRGVALYSL